MSRLTKPLTKSSRKPDCIVVETLLFSEVFHNWIPFLVTQFYLNITLLLKTLGDIPKICTTTHLVTFKGLTQLFQDLLTWQGVHILRRIRYLFYDVGCCIIISYLSYATTLLSPCRRLQHYLIHVVGYYIMWSMT